jgi:hypothetical protein
MTAMRRLRQLAVPVLLCACLSARGDEYHAAPPASVPSYFAEPMPCRVVAPGLDKKTNTVYDHRTVLCEGGLLDGKSLRDLSILRNTIYARWGWDGYRKPWLKAYFASQPWFKPNPKFSYKLLSDADRKNAHFIATKEQDFTSEELEKMRATIFAHHGKVWNDKPEWELKSGKKVHSCTQPKNVTEEMKGAFEEFAGWDCAFAKEAWYKPNPKFSESELTADEKIELGLLSRAMGEFALDDDKRGKTESSLDRVLKPEELRALSLRDLRLLRNTIYARRGRPFKSEILRDHFGGMKWYKVDPAYTDKLLTANDVRNIQLVKSIENEFGGPLSDEDWLTEPATDGA